MSMWARPERRGVGSAVNARNFQPVEIESKMAASRAPNGSASSHRDGTVPVTPPELSSLPKVRRELRFQAPGGARGGSGHAGSFKQHTQTTIEEFTPRLKRNLKYRPAEQRQVVDALQQRGTLANPDSKDILRRVAVVVREKIAEGERFLRKQAERRRRRQARRNDMDRQDTLGQPVTSPMTNVLSGDGATSPTNGPMSPAENEPNEMDLSELFSQEHYVKAQYRYQFAGMRVPGIGVSLFSAFFVKKVEPIWKIPTPKAIFSFMWHIFCEARLSDECSIVSLIYVERLMKQRGLKLLAKNWRPVLLCGLLLASKVWQDNAAWNLEFSNIYPQFSVKSIRKLEEIFLQKLSWKMTISGQEYAQYYFALRAINERKDFRRRYANLVGVSRPRNIKGKGQGLEERSKQRTQSVLSRSLEAHWRPGV